MSTPTKVCNKCNVEKSLAEFNKNSSNKDGLLHQCRPCRREMNKALLEANPSLRARRAAYDKAYLSAPEQREKIRLRVAAWISKFPERKAAAMAVARAVRKGELTKTPCHICGSERSVGHHADYSRPLDVVWLCQRHHKQAHALVQS